MSPLCSPRTWPKLGRPHLTRVIPGTGPEPVERQGPFPSKGPPSGTGLCELNEFAPSGGDMRHRLLGQLFGPGGDSCQLE